MSEILVDSKQFWYRHRKCEVLFKLRIIGRSVGRARSPKPEHPLLPRRCPKKNDIARRITIGERQANNRCIKLLRDLGVCDLEVGFVKMHHAVGVKILSTTRDRCTISESAKYRARPDR